MKSQKHRVRSGGAPCSAALVVVGVGLVLVASTPAQASCARALPQVLWSWPADAAVDVPIDSDLLLATQGFYSSPFVITISGGGADGVEVEAGSALPHHFDLGTLAPHTHYSIDIVAPGAELVGAISFETGEGQSASADDALRVQLVSENEWSRSSFASEGCDTIFFANSCYDTGVPTIQTFAVDAGSSPIDLRSLWVIETIQGGESIFLSLPVACGKPVHFGSSRSGTDYRVYNIGTNGAVRESNLLVGPVLPLPQPTPACTAPARSHASTGQYRFVGSEL